MITDPAQQGPVPLVHHGSIDAGSAESIALIVSRFVWCKLISGQVTFFLIREKLQGVFTLRNLVKPFKGKNKGSVASRVAWVPRMDFTLTQVRSNHKRLRIILSPREVFRALKYVMYHTVCCRLTRCQTHSGNKSVLKLFLFHLLSDR